MNWLLKWENQFFILKFFILIDIKKGKKRNILKIIWMDINLYFKDKIFISE
jgi:hypothetical protein